MDTNPISPDKTEPTKIIHVIRLKLKSDADPTEVQAAIAQLHKMGREISSVRNYCVGKDVGGNYDIGGFYQFDDLAGYAEYLHAPVHRKVDEIGLPLVDDMISFDITDNGEPEIAERIAELHRARYTGDEALAKLVGGLKSFSGSGIGQ